MKNKLIRGLALCLLLSVLHAVAFAEEPRGDLSQRFGEVATIERDGKTLRVKNRLTTVLFAAVDPEAEGADSVLFVALAVVDDDLRRITPVQLCRGMAIVPDGGEATPVYAYFDSAETVEDGCAALLDAVNGLFPEALIEHHVVLDVKGLDQLDGGVWTPSEQVAVTPEEVSGTRSAMATAELDLKARLRGIRNGALAADSSELMEMLDALSGYLYTDMKSGALVKIADKTERYEVVPSVELTGESLPAEDGSVMLVPDADAALDMTVEVFYEETFW